jgi:hypothetical protein
MVLFTPFVQTKSRPYKLNLDRTVYTVFRNIRYSSKSLNVLNTIIVLFVETPRKFITAKLSIRQPGSSSVLIIYSAHIISTDEDPGLRIESFAVINLRGVSTYKTIIYLIAMQTYKELIVLNTVFPKQNISCFEIRWPKLNQFDQLMCFLCSGSAVDIYRAQRKHINYSI